MALSSRRSDTPVFIQQLAKKHGVSTSAVETLHAALERGGGTMAQFSHPELGGYGQWMGSGMIMVGDMFNSSLKAKVDALCSALAQHESGRSRESSPLISRSTGPLEDESPRRKTKSSASSWWPSDYSAPAATGTQNDFKYAYFPQEQALVVERDGEIEIYDTTGHDLSGFGQHQSSSSRFSPRSSRGTVDWSRLPKKKVAKPSSPAKRR